jgi:hypothetical protein
MPSLPNLLSLACALALPACAGLSLPFPEVNVLPDQVREEELRKDPRLEESAYERYRTVPGPGLHLRSSVVHAAGRSWEYWIYWSGAW